jgi:replicative superfamily II helicase
VRVSPAFTADRQGPRRYAPAEFIKRNLKGAFDLFIADEVHLAGNDSSGPTLEMILTKIMHLGLDVQLLSLSATISNAVELSEWLGSHLVEMNWRPVPLREAVYDYGRMIFSDGDSRRSSTSFLYAKPNTSTRDPFSAFCRSLSADATDSTT